MILRTCSLMCVLFLFGQSAVVLAADNSFGVIFALKANSAQRVRQFYSQSVNGQMTIDRVQLPFNITLKQREYQIDKIYPIEIFRNPTLKAKFEERLGGRLYGAKVRVNAPFLQTSAYQQIAGELTRPEILFATQNAQVSVPENDFQKALSTSVVSKKSAGLSNSVIAVTDPLYHEGYNIQLVQADAVWSKILGNRLPITAVIDTGTELTQEDLQGNGFVNQDEIPSNGLDDDHNGIVDDYDKGYSVLEGKIDNNGVDVNGHGTAVASVIGARLNGIGLVGVAPECRILPIRFLNPWGYGFFEDGLVSIGLAIEVISAKSASAPMKGWINNSWLGFYNAEFAATTKILFDLAHENGIGISSAAGNFSLNNDQEKIIPASVPAPNHIAVGASDINDRIPFFSHIGPSSVHLSAPGDYIPIALPSLPFYKEKYTRGSGTSFAAPHVTGAAILISGVYPEATIDEIVARIIHSADRKPSFYKAFIIPGRLNIQNAAREDPIPPADIAWASPLTAYHNQVTFAWQNSADDFTDPNGQSASAIRLELYTADQQLAASKLIAVDRRGFQKENFTDLQENTRYFPVIHNIDHVGNTSSSLSLDSFITPSSMVVLEENFDKNKQIWQKIPDNDRNLWHLTNQRFSESSDSNSTKAFRFGRPGFADYLTKDVVQTAEGHLLSPVISRQKLGGLEIEMDWFLTGDFSFDFLHLMARTELDGVVLSSTRQTDNRNGLRSWQKVTAVIPDLHTDTFRIDLHFTTSGSRSSNETEGAYVDNIKMRASRPVIIFPDPTGY